MPIIYSYPVNDDILDTDLLVGTSTVSVGTKRKNQTKNFSMLDVYDYIITKIPAPTIPTLQQVTTVGSVTTTSITANSFVKTGGLSTQFLMADGSVTTGGGGATPTLQEVAAAGSTYTTGSPDGITVTSTGVIESATSSAIRGVMDDGIGVIGESLNGIGAYFSGGLAGAYFSGGTGLLSVIQPSTAYNPGAFSGNALVGVTGNGQAAIYGFGANEDSSAGIGVYGYGAQYGGYFIGSGVGVYASGTNGASAIFENSSLENFNDIIKVISNGVTVAYTTYDGINVSKKVLINTTTDNGVDTLQINGSLTATAIKKSGGLSTQFLMADGSTSTGGGATPTLQEVSDAGKTVTYPDGVDGMVINLNDPSSNDYSALYVTATGTGNGVTTHAISGFGTSGASVNGVGVDAYSENFYAVSAYSLNGTGAFISSTNGIGAIFNIHPTNTSNIAEFQKNDVVQATISHDGKVTANAIIKTGGTSSQILAADGSVITAGNNITITGGQISSVGGAGGGGSSVNYYLNGGTSQGVFGGTTYYEFSRTAVIGTGADFIRGTNGYIASFITDVADPSLLLIPAGNWNLEFFFSSSSAGGSPSFYAELYKYDGTTFTLITSGSAAPEGITNGTSIDAYFTALAVPETVLTVNDRLAIRIFVNASSKTITLHTQNGHLCEIITTFTAGLTALNGLQAQVQNFSTGTTGTDFAINSSGSTHTFNLPSASASARGVVTTTSQTFAGNKTFTGNTTANSFIKTGGTSSQFLKADGSVDSNTYLTSSNAVLLTGDQSITGIKTFTNFGYLDNVVLNNGNTNFGSSAVTIVNSNAGRGIQSENISVGIGIYSNGTSTGLNYVGANNGTTTFSVDKFGNTTANSFIKTGGTSDEFLKADGSVDSIEVVKNIFNNSPNTSLIGTVTETLLSTFFIPANTFTAQSMPNIKLKMAKQGDNGQSFVKLKVNTINNFTTSTQVATFTMLSTVDTAVIVRNPTLRANFIYIASSATSLISDESIGSNIESLISFNTTIDQWIFVSVANLSVSDLTTLRNFKITN